MLLNLEENSPLPAFRKDIKSYPGPDDADGSPTFNLLDPVRSQYYKINWEQALILEHLRPGITLKQLREKLLKESTVKVTDDEIRSFFDDAFSFNLLEIHKSSEQIEQEASKTQTKLIQGILTQYLSFRIPILKPNEFLTKTLPYARLLASPLALGIYFILTLLGLFLMINRFDTYVNTFVYFFNFNGLIAYILGLVVVKFVHEFAHAYTANYYKIHIASMGIAVLVMYPALYTDVTDAWKLSSRRQRLAISVAGIASELVLAGLCTLGWALTQPGILNSIFFVVSSITWVSSLIINLNPAMRYDGYFLLSDLMRIDNLQPRAFALTRWWIQKHFFGIDAYTPEDKISTRMQSALLIYTIYTWIYRLFLYALIAVIVYFTFTKILGIILFIAEIVFFILIPIFSELMDIIKQKPSFRKSKKFTVFTIVLTLGLLWLVIPLPHSIEISAIAFPEQEQTIYIPEDAQIKEIFVKRGDDIKEGQTLITLSLRKLDAQIADNLLKQEILQKQIYVLGLSDKGLAYLKEKKEELETVKNEWEKFQTLQQDLEIKAKLDGILIDWDPNLKEQQYLSKRVSLGKIVSKGKFKVFGFIPESDLSDIKVGKKAKFYSIRNKVFIPGEIRKIAPVRELYLRYPSLASTHAGPLPVFITHANPLYPKYQIIESYYIVEVDLAPNEVHLLYGDQGSLSIQGPWSSHIVTFINYLMSIFLKESSF